MGTQLSQPNNNLKNSLFTVILCAGEGARLKEITHKTPKPLIKINVLNKKPILHYTIDLLIKLSANRIAIVKGYLGNKIDEFIDILEREKTDLKEILFMVDAKDQYKFGPLYSFLSITKNKQLFQSKYIYLIMPGDTIFQYQLLNEIFSFIKENFKVTQKDPLIFFRKIKGIFLKQKNISKLTSIADIEKINTQNFVKRIKQVNLSNIAASESSNQIIPIFLFPYNFIQEIINIEKAISVKTLREVINYSIKQGKRISAIEIDSNYNFYDIDNQLDLIELEKLREK